MRCFIMRCFDAFQRPPQWLRAVLAGLLLAFALNTIAHASHRHELAAAGTTHSAACAYCITFGGLADLPARTLPARVDLDAQIERTGFDSPALPPHRTIVAQPRAPPQR